MILADSNKIKQEKPKLAQKSGNLGQKQVIRPKSTNQIRQNEPTFLPKYRPDSGKTGRRFG